ncbi:MAG: hypothetical protein KDD13_00395 [Mangrovimonas sp.]|nr:hypothetical protein [Mangrovimonas sp.]
MEQEKKEIVSSLDIMNNMFDKMMNDIDELKRISEEIEKLTKKEVENVLEEK